MPLAIALAALLAPAPADGVGVVWSEATVDPQTKQRVLDALAAAAGSGTRIVDDADLAARLVIAYEVDRAVVERQRGRLEALEVAETAYRSGDAASARAGAEGVLVGAREDPQAPGIVALLVRAHLLRAQILWNEGDAAATDAALVAALTLDPEARLTTRRVPPDLVARHEILRESLIATRSEWHAPNLTIGDEAAIELDGVTGARPVPPGEHVVVIRRPGAAPVGAFVHDGWVPPPPDERLAVGLPADAAHAERICDALELGEVVLVRTRKARAGVQRYRCGGGFARAWYGAREDLDDGVVTATIARIPARGGEQSLSTDAMWPAPIPTITPSIDGPTDGPTTKPWWRRAWVWGLVGTVVVGGVVTGAVLGTRDRDGGYVVDGDSFLGR